MHFKPNIGDSNTAIGRQALFNNTSGTTISWVRSKRRILSHYGKLQYRCWEDAGGAAGESEDNPYRRPRHKDRAFIAGIRGTAVTGAVGLVIDRRSTWRDGILGALQGRDQTDGQSERSILALKPVTFRYKKELDPDGIPQFGLVAEQVESESRSRGS